MGANLCKTFFPDNPGRDPRKVSSSKKLELLTILSFFLGTFMTSEMFFLICVFFLLGVWDCYLAPLLLLLFLELESFRLS